ncbi:ABC transporter ATP-binding protein [Paenibacillus sp. F411]|uniref:ABC transporter ATP-binding protein n=1 Tax=Paenibacillus sp. F411 TaxID=2820239 RepID=UPI001AAE5E0A|nr:ABC transporter ATP-binding protein [Paenibacillus sp. F411]MBO2946141.1 ABC transporter ATP-binding protein [Paenibacillus sp. F411]
MKSSLAWIWPFIRRSKGWYLFGFVIMMAETAFSLGGTWVQKWIIDDVFIAGETEHALTYFVLLGVCLFAAPALFTATAMVHHRIGYALRITLGKLVMNHLYHLPLSHIQKERSARFTDYLVKDIYTVGGGVSYQMPKALQRVVSAVVIMIIIGSVSLTLLLSTTVLCLSFMALGRYLGEKVRSSSRQVSDRKTALTVHMEEGIAATKEVVAFHREAWELERYHRLFKPYMEEVMKAGRLENKQMILSQPLKWSATLVVLAFGGYQVMQGTMSAGLLIVLWQYSSSLMDDFHMIFEHAMQGARLVGTIDRLKRITDVEKMADGSQAFTEPITSMELKKVSFSFQADAVQPILQELDMTLKVGKKNAIVGASGGGKSTISKLLARFYEPEAGDIEVNGHSLSLLQRQDWSERVCIVLQEPYFFPESIRTNLTMGRAHISDEELMALCKAMYIDDFITSLPLGLDQEIGERGVMLSGGQRQRLSLVRALAARPEVLILDEATSALDLETERKIQRSLDTLREGLTTIVIAHRLSTIRNADVIFVIDKGALVEEGNHDILLAQDGLYRKLLQGEEEATGVA